MKKLVLILIAMMIVSIAISADYMLGDWSNFEQSGYCTIGYRNLTDHIVDSYVSYSLISRKLVNNNWQNTRSYFSGKVEKELSANEEVEVRLFNLSKLSSYKPSSDFSNGNGNLYFFITFTVYEYRGGRWVQTSYDNWDTPAF